MNPIGAFITPPHGWELILILAAVLLIFGPKNLPKLGSAIGRFARNLRAGKNGAPAEDEDDLEERPSRPRPSLDNHEQGSVESRREPVGSKDSKD